MISKKWIALIVLFVTLSLEAQVWRGRGRIRGEVTDENGKPIEGAKITLILIRENAGPDPIYTNKKGRWSYLGLVQGEWKVVIEKDGYYPSEGIVQVQEYGAGPNIKTKLVKASALDTGEFQQEVGKADELLSAGEYEKAIEKYNAALQMLDNNDPRAKVIYPQVYRNIGVAYVYMKSYDKAREYFNKALEMVDKNDPKMSKLITSIYQNIATTYLEEKKYKEARSFLEKTLEGIDPLYQVPIKNTIALTYHEEGNTEKAIEILKGIVDTDPSQVDSIELLIQFLVDTGKEEEAEQYVALLPKASDLDPNAILNIGIKYYNEGKMEKALEMFNEAIKRVPDKADPYYYRGLCHMRMQKNSEAKKDFQKFLELAPDHPKASEAREFLKYIK